MESSTVPRAPVMGAIMLPMPSRMPPSWGAASAAERRANRRTKGERILLPARLRSDTCGFYACLRMQRRVSR